MRLAGRTLLLITFLCNFSCSNNKTLFYSDEVFNHIYTIGDGVTGIDYKLFQEPDIILESYSKIITTSFVYQQDENLKGFQGELEVLSFYGKLESEQHEAVNPNYSNIVDRVESDLKEELKGYNIGYIYDSKYSIEFPEGEYLAFEVGKYTKKGEISSFIDSHPDIDFWVILNKSFSNYIYNKVLDKKKILMEGKELLEFDSNLIATIETDYKPYLIENQPISVYIKKR